MSHPSHHEAVRPAWSTREAVRTWRKRAVELLLPPLCLACRAPVEGQGGLCGRCWWGIDFIEPPLCDRLGIPLPYAVGERIVSAAALADPPDYDRARAVARFGDVMRQLIHDLKFRDRHEGMELFAGWLEHAGSELLRDADLIVPVPLHVSRLWARRFNQSSLLGRALSRRTGVPFEPSLLKRRKRTQSQVGLTIDQRRRNVAAAFAVSERKLTALDGRSVLLIDDVITTGATANACAKALKKAGAARVDLLALGRVVDPLTPRL